MFNSSLVYQRSGSAEGAIPSGRKEVEQVDRDAGTYPLHRLAAPTDRFSGPQTC
jgi:hypothetical protein